MHQGAKVVDLVNRNIVGMNIISHVDDNLIARDFEDGTKIKEMQNKMKKSLEEWHKIHIIVLEEI